MSLASHFPMARSCFSPQIMPSTMDVNTMATGALKIALRSIGVLSFPNSTRRYRHFSNI